MPSKGGTQCHSVETAKTKVSISTHAAKPPHMFCIDDWFCFITFPCRLPCGTELTCASPIGSVGTDAPFFVMIGAGAKALITPPGIAPLRNVRHSAMSGRWELGTAENV